MEPRLSEDSKTVKTIKLLFFIVFLPILLGFIKGLYVEILKLSPGFSKSFLWGVIVYLAFHIFIVEPVKTYKQTQKFIQVIFGFLSPILKISYYIIPFWIIIIIGVYFLIYNLFSLDFPKEIFFFFTSFIFMMHITIVAKMIRTDDVHKVINYLFLVVLVLAINIFFLAFTLKIYENSFSVSYIAKQGIDWGVGICQAGFNQLFVPR